VTTIQSQHSHPDSGHGAPDRSHGSHEHDKYKFLLHHFDTPAHQFDSAKLGMWLFLATEVLFFGGLFVAYAVLRNRFPEVFSYASHYLDTIMGGINTCVLILSSLTMALAVRCAQTNRRKGLILCLVLTFMGAIGFMVIKYFEYSHKIHDNLVWGKSFYVPPHDAAGEAEAKALAVAPTTTVTINPANPAVFAVPAIAATPAVEASAIKPASQAPAGLATVHEMAKAEGLHEGGGHDPAIAHPATHLTDAKMPPNTHLFFAVYYAMTGLHGIHVLGGMVMIAWLLRRAVRGDFTSEYFTPVDVGGLYWHIVDLIWIFLFPLFYLIH
jgi:cytochrome c oxidase subunit 3